MRRRGREPRSFPPPMGFGRLSFSEKDITEKEKEEL
jgi:hypothetical protein